MFSLLVQIFHSTLISSGRAVLFALLEKNVLQQMKWIWKNVLEDGTVPKVNSFALYVLLDLSALPLLEVFPHLKYVKEVSVRKDGPVELCQYCLQHFAWNACLAAVKCLLNCDLIDGCDK